ncbi:Imm31 family immunity protein [Stenotrophomonas terrae]|uniref:Imm31 family immunity protein n=1 Tax=Stenotrophomonas terrae TaxID=405446 RepID=UPI00320A062C
MHVKLMGNSGFDFYAVVRVKVGADRPVLQAIDGRVGAVLGMAQAEDGSWTYAVHIIDLDESWSIGESELVATGRTMKRKDFYGGEVLSVEVDRKWRGERSPDE